MNGLDLCVAAFTPATSLLDESLATRYTRQEIKKCCRQQHSSASANTSATAQSLFHCRNTWSALSRARKSSQTGIRQERIKRGFDKCGFSFLYGSLQNGQNAPRRCSLAHSFLFWQCFALQKSATIHTLQHISTEEFLRYGSRCCCTKRCLPCAT